MNDELEIDSEESGRGLTLILSQHLLEWTKKTIKSPQSE
jgi:hypothetical protein